MCSMLAIVLQPEYDICKIQLLLIVSNLYIILNS